MTQTQENFEAEPRTVDLTDYLRILRERLWLVILLVVVVVAVTLTVDYTLTPKYRATTTLVLQRTNLDQAFLGTQLYSVSNQARDVETGATLVKQQPVAEAVKNQLQLSLSADQLLSMVSVKASSESV